MKYLTDVEAVTELAQWGGADATVVEYGSSLSRILIRLSHYGDPRALCVGLVGCQSYSGPLRWTNALVDGRELT